MVIVLFIILAMKNKQRWVYSNEKIKSCSMMRQQQKLRPAMEDSEMKKKKKEK